MRTSVIKFAIAAVFAVSVTVPQHHVNAGVKVTVTKSFVSDADTRVYESDPALGQAKSLGRALPVCLTPDIPVTCPTGALVFGYPASPASWDADLSPIAGAVWVWAPKITAESLATIPSTVFFSQKIKVSGTPLNASVSIALDSYGEVYVNGVFVGSHGSLVDIGAAYDGQHRLATFDVTPYVVRGVNIITLKVQNDVGDFSPFGCVPNCTYAQDPAGAAFGGQITFVRNGSGNAADVEVDSNE